MLILLEGVDATGKSTTARRLRTMMNKPDDVRVLKCGPLKTDPFDAYEVPLEGYRPGGRNHVIYDRHYLGELVYGPFLRGTSRVDPTMQRHIELFLAARGAVLIYLEHDDEIVAERLRVRGDRLIKPEHVTQLRERYEAVLTDVNLPTFRLRDPGVERLASVLNLASFLDDKTKAIGDFPTYVGEPDPKILLLGERRGVTSYASAFVPKRPTSGYFLLQHLRVKSFGLANACEENVEKLWETTGKPAVVTLGREAHRVAESYGVPHGQMPHPQYVRRFHHRRGSEYAAAIVKAADMQCDLTMEWR